MGRDVTAARYVLGCGALVSLVGLMGAGAASLRAALLPEWRGAPARLADCVLALALLTLICEGLGTVGLFRLGPILAACAAIGAGLVVSCRRHRLHLANITPPVRRQRGVEALGLAIGIVVAGAVLTEWAERSLHSYLHGIPALDSLWYHLPWAAWYAQSGQVASLHFMDVQYLSAFYPASGELLHGLGITVMGTDVLSPIFNLLFLGLSLLAGWCIGRPWSLSPVTVTGTALAMGLADLVYSQPGTADTDTMGIFYLLAAVALLLNSTSFLRPLAPSPSHSAQVVGTRAMLIAGLAAGLAISVKLTLLVPVLALTLAVVAAGASGRRRAIGGAWVAAVIVAGGFWYVRNAVAIGNPVPWFSFGGVLPAPHPALMDATEYSVWHYLTDASLWSRLFVPALGRALGPWWPVIVAIVVLGSVLCVAAGPEREVRLIGLVTLASIVGYLVTPGTAAGVAGHPAGFQFNLRYSAPALALGLATVPLAGPLRGRRPRSAMLAGLVTILAVSLSNHELWVAHELPAALVAAVLLLLAGLALSRGGSRRASAIAPHRQAVLGAAAVLVIAAAGVGGYAVEHAYLRSRYASAPHKGSLATLWNWARTLHHVRIALGGTAIVSLQYPLWGADDSNRVDYVARHGPHGSFIPITTCHAWREALNVGRYRYVVTSDAADAVTRRFSYSPEGDWTLRAPGVRRLRLEGLPSHSWLRVFEIVGPLDPGACGAR
jgi:hypothetical protein